MNRPPAPFSAFRTVPRTGVIYVMTEPAKKGYHGGHSEWANLGIGAPETGSLPGAPERLESVSFNTEDHECAPAAGFDALRDAVADPFLLFAGAPCSDG